MRRLGRHRRRTALAVVAASVLVVGPAPAAYADSDPVTITVRERAVSPAGHLLVASIRADSTDPGARVSVSGSGYVKPDGDGSVVTIRVVGADGIAVRPGPGRLPLRNPESGALLDTGLGDWAVVKAGPDGLFTTTFRLPNGRDSVPRLDPEQVYSVQLITGSVGADDLVSSLGTASGLGDTRLLADQRDSPVQAVAATDTAATPPPQPVWRSRLLPASALLAAAMVALVLARRRPQARPR